jgi:ACS family hexuronate transporter-like MFS transporter
MFMTLLAALAVQWTGTQQIVFVWAGGMHLAALLLFWFWFKGRFEQVNVDTAIDESRAHRGLISSGMALMVFGAMLCAWEYNNLTLIVSVVKATGAASAAVVAGGFVIIGLALIYAGMAKRRSLPA